MAFTPLSSISRFEASCWSIGGDFMSAVTDTPCATAEAVVARYVERLAFETDCWDVHDAIGKGADFVLLDVRSPALFSQGHVPGAISLPHSKISEVRMSQWPRDTLFVVYCAGPHCNGADRAALRLGKLGRRVKLMIGGMTGWIDEGFSLETDA
jgi:rhodanese-related sulfurtransferase